MIIIMIILMIMNANNTAFFSFSSPYVREYRLPSAPFLTVS
jgi:hypothetical protein